MPVQWQKTEPPPAARGPRNAWADTLADLKSKPGEWGIVNTVDAERRKGGQIPGYQSLRDAGCKVATRREGDKVNLWACWPKGGVAKKPPARKAPAKKAPAKKVTAKAKG